MANVIRIKRRLDENEAAPGAPSSLKNAELAFNEVDQKLYYGKGADGSGNATSIIAIGGVGWDSSPDLSGYAELTGATFTGGVNVGTSEDPEDLVVHGNLTVNGTTLTVNAETVEVEDKNIVLGKVETPTDTTADGGGITLKGTTDKTFNWVDADDAWTSSEHVKLAAGKDLIMSGATSGAVTVVVPDVAGSNTVTLPAATGTVALTNDKLSAFAATTSAELAGVISDETGSGSLVFATSPTLTTPTLGVASATSVNKVAITAPADAATLTIANNKTLTVNNTLTFEGTDASTVTFGAGGTVVYESTVCTAIANCALDGGSF